MIYRGAARGGSTHQTHITASSYTGIHLSYITPVHGTIMSSFCWMDKSCRANGMKVQKRTLRLNNREIILVMDILGGRISSFKGVLWFRTF